MPWNRSLTDLMNQVANSAMSALQVDVRRLSAGGAVAVSATNLDVSIPDTIAISTPGAFSVSGEVGISAYTTIDSGMTSAVAASTAYQLPSVTCRSVAVKADDDNTNKLYIGASDVAGDGANGYRLEAGQGISLQLDNVNRVYFIADTAGEKIYWIVIN